MCFERQEETLSIGIPGVGTDENPQRLKTHRRLDVKSIPRNAPPCSFDLIFC